MACKITVDDMPPGIPSWISCDKNKLSQLISLSFMQRHHLDNRPGYARFRIYWCIGSNPYMIQLIVCTIMTHTHIVTNSEHHVSNVIFKLSNLTRYKFDKHYPYTYNAYSDASVSEYKCIFPCGPVRHRVPISWGRLAYLPVPIVRSFMLLFAQDILLCVKRSWARMFNHPKNNLDLVMLSFSSSLLIR